MIGINYKSKLMFYEYIEEKNHKQKNEEIRKKVYKMSGPIIQERYSNEILPLVHKRKLEIEAEGRQFIYQEDNDGSTVLDLKKMLNGLRRLI